jgi:hypothetical protein
MNCTTVWTPISNVWATQSQNARFPLVKISTKGEVNCSYPVQIQGNDSSNDPGQIPFKVQSVLLTYNGYTDRVGVGG